MNGQSFSQSPVLKRTLFTHNDLDGVACGIIFAKCYPTASIFFCDNDLKPLYEWLDTYDDTVSDLIITDLGITPELAQRFAQRGHVSIVDHHTSAEWLNKYDWATVDPAHCAAYHLYNILSYDHHLEDYKNFIDIVDNHDRWVKPSQLSTLLGVMGIDRFFNRFVLDSKADLMPHEQTIIDMEEDYKANYIAETIPIAQEITDAEGYQVAIVPCELYHSNVGDAILKTNTRIEYVMMIDLRLGKCHMRGRGNKDLSVFAKECGGGGHPKAAGFPISHKKARTFLRDTFKL
jgi:oligoribonuclease NrnB/cAMP/cGMP phosphodiesterase (DHH superfamily)